MVKQRAFLGAIREARGEQRQKLADIEQRENAILEDATMEASQRKNSKNNGTQSTDICEKK